MKKISAICIASLMLTSPSYAAPSAGKSVESAIALAYIAHRCAIKLNRSTDAWAVGLVQAADPKSNAAGVAQGERAFRTQVSLMGRKKACAKARGILKEQGWL